MTRRKMLAADEALANKVSKLANRKGSTIYQTVNEILEEALEAESLGYNLSTLVDERKSIDRAGSLGLGLTFDSLFDDLVDLCFSETEDAWIDVCKERGVWYGKYFAGKDDALKGFLETLEYLALNKAEVALRRNGNAFDVCVIGARCSESWFRTYRVFMESALEVLGYSLIDCDIETGIMRLGFRSGAC